MEFCPTCNFDITDQIDELDMQPEDQFANLRCGGCKVLLTIVPRMFFDVKVEDEH